MNEAIIQEAPPLPEEIWIVTNSGELVNLSRYDRVRIHPKNQTDPHLYKVLACKGGGDTYVEVIIDVGDKQTCERRVNELAAVLAAYRSKR